jgi:UDP-N-acetylmuramate dehydrogenase
MTKFTDFLSSANIVYSLNASLKELSSFKIGGSAAIICYPDCAEKAAALVKYCNENGMKYMTFGRCSNVLFPDSGLLTPIIKTDKMNSMVFSDGLFCFGAGVMLAKASKYTVDKGYAGMEFAYGIPGSVGGAVYMNAGAYGGEMSQCIEKTEYVDDRGNICVLEQKLHEFGYRHSYFSDKNYIITKTYVSLEKGDRSNSAALIDEFQSARKSKQPLDMPSAGSVFKRPQGYFAGKLIEDSGLKGAFVGGAMVSTKHSGFIVNYDNASERDVRELISVIQNKVMEKYGVLLECELKFIED